jgi:ornithine cyclodeaminase/alanine dehydrogenase-like protein (mu-crystallin family)
MKVFNESQTREALPFATLISNLAAMFRVGCEVPARHVHAVGQGVDQGTLLIMPAWNDRYLGIKTVNVYPGNSKLGLPGLSSAYTLFDARTGQVLALMDGDVITSRRTAASSALAASYLARPQSKRLLVVGPGKVGSLLPLAYREVFDLERVDVWARKTDKARELARQLTERGIASFVAPDIAHAARSADIIACATLASSPVVFGAWLQPGSHLDLIGSFNAQMRETDDAALRGAHVFVDTEEALQKSGDLIGALARAVISRDSISGTLAQLCRETVSGRHSSTQRTVFKSVGTALEDLAAAIQVHEYWLAKADTV